MTSERIQRQIERLLDEAEEAAGAGEWNHLRELCERVLTLSPSNADAEALLAAAERGASSPGATSTMDGHQSVLAATPQPTSFASGRYEVKRFLGEGANKRVYLAHDTTLVSQVPSPVRSLITRSVSRARR